MENSEIGVNRLYRHADGGIYRTLGFLEIKMDNGLWKKGIRYISLSEQGVECGTTLERFKERFFPEYVGSDEYEAHE